MNKKWVFVLLGNNQTGKTTFQKKLIEYLSDFSYKRLRTNGTHYLKKIKNYEDKKYFFAGRSYQETKYPKHEYNSVIDYFKKIIDCYLKNEKIMFFILSSHLVKEDIRNIVIANYLEKGHMYDSIAITIFLSVLGYILGGGLDIMIDEDKSFIVVEYIILIILLRHLWR